MNGKRVAMKKSRQQVWNILSNAIFTTLGNIRRNLCTSSVVPESLVAPVARATTLSLLCICCVLHAKVHPQRSARVARFARSLAARQQSNLQTSLYVFLPILERLGSIVRPFGGVFGRLGVVLDLSWAVLEQTWRVLGCLRHLLPM